jgi:hypothetical protein
MRENHGMYRSAEYRAYKQAKGRCQNVYDRCYVDYGRRGIEFRFETFAAFYKELGKRPSSVHSLDRTDNNGHYEVGNVKWSTKSEQVSNRRRYTRTRGNAKGYTKHRGKFRVQFSFMGTAYYGGLFATRKEAHAAYIKQTTELHNPE